MTAAELDSFEYGTARILTAMYSFIRQAFFAYRRKHKPSSSHRRRKRKLPLGTREWLVLTFGIAMLVGTIFILALYYQPGR